MTRTKVVLTGLPRGSTTLMCRLLDVLPDTVSLHEAIPLAGFADRDYWEDSPIEVRKNSGRCAG